MSGISSTSAAGGTASTVGTNLAPITFPGISSGIDYNAIISKLTALTLAPNTQYNAQITQLSAKNAELIKINALLSSVQGALTTLSDPATFNAYAGTTNDPLDANLTQLPGGNAVPGSYRVSATHVATATQISSGSSVGVTMNSNLSLMCAGTAIVPSNGPSGQGIITVDGVAVRYDVSSESLNTIAGVIYSAVHAVDAGFSIAVGSNGSVSLSSTDQPISLGSSGDTGNLAQVLKLDVAQMNNAGPPYSISSAGPVGGVNEGAPLLGAGNAGFATTVTSGTFTINGVSITVNALDDNVASVLSKINSSTAGVVASYNLISDTFALTSKSTGPQGIVVGSPLDTSTFLRAAELETGTGATTTVGQQAFVAVLTNTGALETVYSNSDAVAGAIPGMAFNVTGTTDVPFTVTVAQNAAPAINAISNFVSLYNAALSEIAIATAPPVVQQVQSSTTALTTSSSSVLAAGGVLYGDQTIQAISSQLTQYLTALANNGSTSYNSLQSIGLALDSSHTVYQSNTNSYGGAVNATTSGPIATSSADGTDGKLLPLDIAKFSAAFAANPSAVASLFISTSSTSTSGLSNQLGAFLTGVTGTPTSLITGLVGKIPIVSLLQADENGGTAEISSLNQSIKNVTDKANAQADLLRAQATASEALVAKYQSEQSAVNQLSGTTSS